MVEDIDEKINLVSSMFPHIPKSIIEQDLRSGSRVQETCEKILAGKLSVREPQVISQNHELHQSSSTPSKVKITEKLIDKEPPKIWQEDPKKREELLKQRKAYMIQQARLKLKNDL